MKCLEVGMFEGWEYLRTRYGKESLAETAFLLWT